MDWTTASAGVRQDHPVPEERCHERPLMWKAEWCFAKAAAEVAPVAAALWHHDDWLKKMCQGQI